MKKIINQAPIVRYRASVSEIFFPGFWNGTFSAESFWGLRNWKSSPFKSLNLEASGFLAEQRKKVK